MLTHDQPQLLIKRRDLIDLNQLDIYLSQLPIVAEDVPSKDIPLQAEALLFPKSVSGLVREWIDERLDLPTG
jgi:hypothetical protein